MVRRAPRRFARTLRVNEVVREVLGDELERLGDPRLEMVTVTGVEVSPDLRHAIVYFAALGNHDPGIAEALEKSSPRLKRSLARETQLKYVPALHFREDPAIEAGQRVEEILREMHRKAES